MAPLDGVNLDLQVALMDNDKRYRLEKVPLLLIQFHFSVGCFLMWKWNCISRFVGDMGVKSLPSKFWSYMAQIRVLLNTNLCSSSLVI